MKTTIVPAQVTTVEDKIAGNLSVTQLFLLTLPVFLDGALFVLVPPLTRVTAFKIFISALVAMLCLSLAIRLKGKLVLQWLVVMSCYGLRPRYYVYNKNDSYLRSRLMAEPPEETTTVVATETDPEPLILLPTAARARLEQVLADPRAQFHFKADRKGGLRVHIHEIKEEGL